MRGAWHPHASRSPTSPPLSQPQKLKDTPVNTPVSKKTRAESKNREEEKAKAREAASAKARAVRLMNSQPPAGETPPAHRTRQRTSAVDVTTDDDRPAPRQTRTQVAKPFKSILPASETGKDDGSIYNAMQSKVNGGMLPVSMKSYSVHDYFLAFSSEGASRVLRRFDKTSVKLLRQLKGDGTIGIPRWVNLLIALSEHSFGFPKLQARCRRIIGGVVKKPWSKMPPEWKAKKCQLREWRCKAYKHWQDAFASKVTIAPSNVNGIGVFTTSKIKEGETVCIYSGKMRKGVTGYGKYILKLKYWNQDTKKHETWYLDAEDKMSAVGRYINDACDTYPEGTIHEKFRTIYHTNVGYKSVINPKPHAWLGYFVQVFALCDIPEGVELFAAYGKTYWGSHQKYFKGEDPDLRTGADYEKAIEEALSGDLKPTDE